MSVVAWTPGIMEYNESVAIFAPQRLRMGEEQKMNGWNLAPEDIPHIPPHWLSFPAPEASLHYLLAVIYLFFTFFSLAGNGIVIWVFSR